MIDLVIDETQINKEAEVTGVIVSFNQHSLLLDATSY